MKRVLVTVIFALVTSAVWQSLASHLPLWLNLFFLPPLILVFSLQFFRPLETLMLCLLCGLIVDILGGFMLGANMIIMLMMAFMLTLFNVFSGRVYREEQCFYVMAVSLVFRLIALIANLILMGDKANILLMQLILGPPLDGILSIVLFRLLVKALSLVKAMDQSEYFNNRLGFRQ